MEEMVLQHLRRGATHRKPKRIDLKRQETVLLLAKSYHWIAINFLER